MQRRQAGPSELTSLRDHAERVVDALVSSRPARDGIAVLKEL
jgi:hypothetical protein